MKSSLDRARELWRAFIRPDLPERRAAIRAAWDRLPPPLRGADQALGRQNAGCAATHHVMERCDFSCTACYLSDKANSTPPLPWEEVRAQLDEIRVFLGPGGKTQITGGEVTLLPAQDLIRILRHCRAIDLDPMVMSHGERFRREPAYLERLVAEGGLRKVAIHVDSTQRGRGGAPRRPRERDLHPIRDEFAELIRSTRRNTGRPLHASHTFTVTEKNLAELPDVIAWSLRNADAFRMLSLQPTADVGRTREAAMTTRPDRVWAQIHRGLGRSINPRTFHFGHPDCNQVALMFVVELPGEPPRVVEVARDGFAIDRRFFRRLLSGGFAGFSHDDDDDRTRTGLRLLARLLRDPRLLMEIPGYCAYRAWTERRWLPRLLGAVARGAAWSVRPFVIVVHNFMSRDQLDTAAGRERLEGCVFRLPVGDRMVPMCEMNGTELRRSLNLEVSARMRSERSDGAARLPHASGDSPPASHSRRSTRRARSRNG